MKYVGHMRVHFVNGTKQTIDLGSLMPTQTKTVQWLIECPKGVCPKEFVTITASGEFSFLLFFEMCV